MSSEPTIELAPCAFCGNTQLYLDHELIDQVPGHFVVCRLCGAEGPFSMVSAETAQTMWNRRAVAA